MSGITSVSGNSASLLSLLAGTDSSSSAPSLLDSLVASGLENLGQNSAAPSTGTDGSSALLNQVQAAITSALQTAEQSGASNLKGAAYNALVQVLDANGIDPKTFQPTGGSGQPAQAGTSTNDVLAEVLSAISQACAASDPLTQLLSAQSGSQGSSDPFALAAGSASTGSTLGNSLSQLLSSQTSNQNLLGFLFDSGQ